MKRKRGRKPGHKKGGKTNAVNKESQSPNSASAEENDFLELTDNVQFDAEVNTELLPSHDKQSPLSNSAIDVSNDNSMGKAGHSRVKVKLRYSRAIAPHQNSSSPQTPSDTDKSHLQVPLEMNEAAAEKDTAYSDGPASERKSSVQEKLPKKAGKIKIKPSKSLASSSEIIQDKNANKVNGSQSTIERSSIGADNEKTAELSVSRNKAKLPHQGPRYKEKELNDALAVIKKVMKMDAAVPFNAPVNPVALGIPDYFDVIATPMDFGTICHDLEHGQKYMNSEDVYKDVHFIWENCNKYNNKGDYILDLMKRVKKAFMKYWLAAGLYSGVPDNGHTENTQIEDDAPAGHGKIHPKGKLKNKRRRYGVDRHKSDCLCAVCVVTRRRKEREGKSPVIDSQMEMTDDSQSQQFKLEERSPLDNHGSQDASSLEHSPEMDANEIETENEVEVEVPEHVGSVKPEKMDIISNENIEKDQNHTRYCINNQRSQSLPLENGDEDSTTHYEEQEAEHSDDDEQEERISVQPKDYTIAHHHQEESPERSKVVKLRDSPVQQENHSVMEICKELFPSDRSSVWRGPHSIFRDPVSDQSSPIHSAIATILKR